MYLKIKNLIETNVNKINHFLFLLIFIIFPINQQYHFRPFSSVEGFIIDYLIIKISVQEIIFIFIFILNFFAIFRFFKSAKSIYIFLLFLVFVLVSILNSKYPYLALYDNLTWGLIIFCSLTFLRSSKVIKNEILVYSIKFWLIFLVTVGVFQFLNQGSIFNNYPITGEYPYSEDNLFIKQKNTLLTEFVPSMGIFSHANIFGAYFLFLLFILRCFNQDRIFFHILGVVVFLITGSLPVLISYIIWLFLIVFPKILNFNFLPLILFILIFAFILLPTFFDTKLIESNYSVFRRVYLLIISKEYFTYNPLGFLFGFGYMNYFSIVKNNLWDYEIIRFFQPPHNIFILTIWNYGFIFLSLVFYLVYKIYKSGNFETKIFLILVLILGSFDHYILTNHQFQILGIIIPYSLFLKNKV